VHAVVHAWVFGSQELPVGQSVYDWHPHVPPFDVNAHAFMPAGFPLQSVQAPPVSPHAVFEPPPWHVPLAPQHPPLHGCVGEHVDTHVCVERSHARSDPQSAALLQPHFPLATQALPFGDVEQSMHAPDAPHASATVPELHTPFAEQHPVAHGSVWQDGPHLCVKPSQIVPDGHSSDVPHPHAPATQ